MNRSVCDAALYAEGFRNIQGLFGEFFVRAGSGEWELYAYPEVASGAAYSRIDIGLTRAPEQGRSIRGPRHRVLSAQAMTNNLPRIISELLAQSLDDTRMRCPKCGTRYVHLKEPHSGQSWSPFLSCDGAAMLSGRGANRGFACDGTMRGVAPIIVHK